MKTTLSAAITILLLGLMLISNPLHTTMLSDMKDETYDKLWQRVDSLTDSAMPKAALAVAEEIMQLAIEDDNQPNYLKALLYSIRLRSDFEENSFEKSIDFVEKSIVSAKMPALSVLHSILAELYLSYFSLYRHVILDRTVVDALPGQDIKTWDATALISKAAHHYRQSVKHQDTLKSIPAEIFSIILDEKEDSKIYRPTLFDLMAHRALNFFTNPQASLIQPHDPFSLNDEKLFAEAAVFANEVLATPDTLSFNYQTIELFRQLIAFHMKGNRTLAMIDVDLKRLSWLRSNSSLTNKNELYIQALEQIKSHYGNTEAFPEIAHAIATEMIRIGNTWHPFSNPEPRLKIMEAKEKLESAIDRFPDLPFTNNCQRLLQQISEPGLQIEIEQVVLPGEPFKALVSHKNTEGIYLRLIRIEPETDREYRGSMRNSNDRIKAYLELKPFRTWHQALPDDGDMQTHNTEIPIQALPVGYYVLIAGFDEEFSIESDKRLPIASFWSSSISYVNRRLTDGSTEFMVLDRKNGSPMHKVAATTYIQRYNHHLRRQELIKSDTYKTSRNGTFIVESPENRRPENILIDFSYKSDRLFSDRFFWLQRYERDTRVRTHTQFFTDRAIYRPGQVVYFKGIVIDTDGETHEIKANMATTVVLYDANNRKISELRLSSNDYGTFSGSFALPTGTLTGNFRLSNEYGTVGFSVEEYKLPRFEVVFDTPEDSYKLGESITIRGQALAYAGNPISNADARFRVTRQTRFPIGFHRAWDIFPLGPPTEILNGMLQTDAEGYFTITFTATPDIAINKQHNPVFIFNVKADVTDIQGETQSGSTSIGVGYVALLLSTNIPDNINREDFDGFVINATNLNGHDQHVRGEMILKRLKQPDRLLRERSFTRPSRFVMDEAAHNKMFPLDVYDNEDDPYSWDVEEEILAMEFDTGQAGKILPESFKEWDPGTYLIELKTTDIFGEEVEFKKHFTVFAPSDKMLPVEQLWWTQVLTHGDLAVGEKAQIMIGSSARLPLLYEVELNGEIVSSRRLPLNRSTMVIEIPVTEAHLGGFRVHFTSVVHNRVVAETIFINVSDRRKELNLMLETNRNRLEPGSQEEFLVRITDYEGNPVSAEMLAGMYDASLDALRTHNWFLNLYRQRPRGISWESTASFRTVSAHAFFHTRYPDYYFREYDRLNWFDFDRLLLVILENRFFTRGAAAPMMAMDMAVSETVEMEVAEEGMKATDVMIEPLAAQEPTTAEMAVRRDFRETAFFYPHLLSDDNGFVSLRFTLPESLTRWRLMGMAHTKDLKTGFFEEFFESNREVMVGPNPPRFLRQGDSMDFRAKVVNTTDQEINALVKLELFDAVTMESVNELYDLASEQKPFTISAKGAEDVSWEINVPLDGPYAVIYRVTASAGAHSDGEENMLPVLTNRKLLTESMPMFAGAGENRTFTLDRLLQSGQPGSTAVNHKLTLEFTSNPVWYAVQALPYLSEPSYRSTEAIFQQVYANLLAKHIVDANPEIERVFEVWRRTDSSELLSNLEKNEDLKSVVIEETPWLTDALGESERKRQIAVLFDRNHIAVELEKNLRALSEMQLSNGGWPWMPGMRDSRHVTQQLVAGLGRLQALGAMNIESDRELLQRLQKAVRYLDEHMTKEYNELDKPVDIQNHALSALTVQYLWARSYWTGQFPIDRRHQESFTFWKGQAEKHWTKQGIYFQGMIALALHRLGESDLPEQILRSLSDRALRSDEMGMYWRDLRQGFHWYQAPIETQALLVEAYATIGSDMAAVEKMQQWLITQKRTQAWKSNRATAEAVYAVLMRGTQRLTPNRNLDISIGDININPASDPEILEEAGSGYFRISWSSNEISPDKAQVTVNNDGGSMVWGGLYWQYFEQLDRIVPHETPLKLSRSIMREVLTPSGPLLEPVSDEKPLNIGDKMIMRIELRVDRDLEYVHMKDLRAPAFEPIEQLSGYRYQGGLGYYESPRDAGTHFFFQYLPKGTYVFEYPVVVSQSGNFSTGITTIQCLYAPEFTAHSEGVRVVVE